MASEFAIIPRRLMMDEVVLVLPLLTQSVLLRLYAVCDRYGRLPADEMALRARLAVMDGTALRPHVEALGQAGLVLLYEVDGRRYAQLDRYDEDQTSDMLRKRGRPEFPAPQGQTKGAAGEPQGQTKGAAGAPQGQTKGAAGAPQGQTKGAAGAPQGRPQPDPDPDPEPDHQALCGGVDPPSRAGAREDAPTAPCGAAPTTQSATDSADEELALVPAERRDELQSQAARSSSATWPSSAHEEAGRRWWEHLTAVRPMHAVRVERLRALAVERQAEFVEAVDQHCRMDKGWKFGDPLKWLFNQCGIVADSMSDRSRQGRGSGIEALARSKPASVATVDESWDGWEQRQWDALCRASRDPERRQALISEAGSFVEVAREHGAPDDVVQRLESRLAAWGLPSCGWAYRALDELAGRLRGDAARLLSSVVVVGEDTASTHAAVLGASFETSSEIDKRGLLSGIPHLWLIGPEVKR